jgi:hypothetical protein
MRLKLDELQKVVKRTIDEEKAVDALKAEIGRVLGPSVVTEGRLLEVVMSANDWLDVLERTGRSSRLDWRPSATASFLDYRDPEVRKFAARVCPEKFLPKMVNDKSSVVRAAVASRLNINGVREMIRRFPKDDQLRAIYNSKKKLVESGVKQPEKEPMGIDISKGAERLGDAVKQKQGPELSEAWYHQHAMQFMHQYGQNIEYAWEELAVHRFAASLRATSLMEVDEKKLLKCIKDLIKEKEDNTMERNALKETLSFLKVQEDQELLAEGMIPDTGLNEESDPVRDLVYGGLTGEQFVEGVKKLFRVQLSTMSASLRKYRLGEGNAKQTLVPCIGMLPHTLGFRAIDERCLDTFCEAWSRQQELEGEPLRLEWTNHPADVNKVGFTCILR